MLGVACVISSIALRVAAAEKPQPYLCELDTAASMLLWGLGLPSQFDGYCSLREEDDSFRRSEADGRRLEGSLARSCLPTKLMVDVWLATQLVICF